jgi:DNA-binding HxlR family transcriptional regulator
MLLPPGCKLPFIRLLSLATETVSLLNQKRKGASTMTIPRPGKAVRGSRSGRPIMAALDLLGRRWALRVVWELRDGSLSFRALQERCDGMSPSVLMRRLDELRETGIVATDPEGGYALTDEGRGLLRALAPLDGWARAWAKRRS